jgi:hypothetical protein
VEALAGFGTASRRFESCRDALFVHYFVIVSEVTSVRLQHWFALALDAAQLQWLLSDQLPRLDEQGTTPVLLMILAMKQIQSVLKARR